MGLVFSCSRLRGSAACGDSCDGRRVAVRVLSRLVREVNRIITHVVSAFLAYDVRTMLFDELSVGQESVIQDVPASKGLTQRLYDLFSDASGPLSRQHMGARLWSIYMGSAWSATALFVLFHIM